jgi:uncharacterized membrane protein
MSKTPEQERQHYKSLQWSFALFTLSSALLAVTNIEEVWRVAHGGETWPYGLALELAIVTVLATGQSLLIWDLCRRRVRALSS